jgi:hypothetical protein
MPNLTELTRKPEPADIPEERKLVSAVVIDAGPPLEVRLPAYSDRAVVVEHFDGTPVVGDEVLLALDEDGDEWVVAGVSMEDPIDATYASGWSDISGSFEGVRYYKDPAGLVHVEGGALRTGVFTFAGAGSTIFTLPSGYRPEKQRDYLVAGFDGTDRYPAVVRVETDGDVVVLAASGRRADGTAAVAGDGTFVFLGVITLRPLGV